MAKSDDKTNDKISSENVNNNNLKHNISINMCEVERAFKRLRVDDSLNTKIINNKSIDNSFDSSLKHCSNSLRKSSSQDKRQTLNAFRRRIPTLSSIKEKNNSCLDSKDKTIEDDYEFGAKSNNIYKDFSQMNLFVSKRTQSSNNFCFKNDSKALSDWRTSDDNNCNKNDNKVNKSGVKEEKSCARQALCDTTSDASVDELAAYFDDNLYLPRKMSFMAEMMYT